MAGVARHVGVGEGAVIENSSTPKTSSLNDNLTNRAATEGGWPTGAYKDRRRGWAVR